MTRMVLLHGLGQTADSWRDVLRELDGGETLCPQIFQLPTDGPLDYPRLYRALCGYLDGVPGRFVLCGLSLGGVLALQYAIEHGDRLSSLALIAPQFDMPKKLLALQNTLFRLMPAKAFEPMGLAKVDVVRLCGSMASLNFRDRLGEVSCPALVIYGEKDRANLGAARELARLLPKSQLRLIPRAGHEVNVQAPQELGAVLQELLHQDI